MDPTTDRFIARALPDWALDREATRLLRRFEGGHRNHVWLVEVDGVLRIAKTTRRSEEAIAWMLPVLELAERCGLTVAPPLPRRAGGFIARVDTLSVTLEPFLDGTPLETADRNRFTERLERFHQSATTVGQRPGFAAAHDLLTGHSGGDVDLRDMPPELVARCRNAWAAVTERPHTVVHGDANENNLLSLPGGGIGLIDWDEARVDAALFDRAVLGLETGPTEHQAATAWEIAASWHIEPHHARTIARRIGWLPD